MDIPQGEGNTDVGHGVHFSNRCCCCVQIAAEPAKVSHNVVVVVQVFKIAHRFHRVGFVVEDGEVDRNLAIELLDEYTAFRVNRLYRQRIATLDLRPTARVPSGQWNGRTDLNEFWSVVLCHRQRSQAE